MKYNIEKINRIAKELANRTQFQNQMQRVRTQVGELLRQDTTCTHSGTAGTCRDILKREASLWTFVDVEYADPTNGYSAKVSERKGKLE